MKASEKEALVHECLVKNYEKYYRMAYSYVFCEQDTWICKIVINEALRFLKKNKLESVDMESLPEQGKEDEVEDIDLQRALEKLDNQERAIVVLRYFEEEKLENIGKTMNLNVNTVKSRLYRAMDKLKKYMETGGAEYGKLEKGV